MASTAHADAQTMGDDAAADAADIEVPEYDEDETEAFHGPDLLRGVELEEDEDFRDGESGSIEAMESQWAESGYTHDDRDLHTDQEGRLVWNMLDAVDVGAAPQSQALASGRD